MVSISHHHDTYEELLSATLAKLEHLRPQLAESDGEPPSLRALDSFLLGQAASQLGIARTVLDKEVQILGKDPPIGFVQNMSWSLVQLDRSVTHDKELTKRLLETKGLPVARGAAVKSVAEATEYFKTLKAAAVVKPLTGAAGRGVTVNITNERELAVAVSAALSHASIVLVEECVISIDLRVTVAGGKAAAASLRVPANIIGDGVSTVKDLVTQKNLLRQRNPYLRSKPIRFTTEALERLDRAGISSEDVLPAGHRHFLHYKANLSAGGDSYEIIDLVHRDILRLAEQVAACFSSAGHAGIDILVERFDSPLEGQRCVVCEVNCNNDMPMHHFPLFGKPSDAATAEITGYFGHRNWISAAARRLARPIRALGRAPNRRNSTVPAPRPDRWAKLRTARVTIDNIPENSFSSVRNLDDHFLAQALHAGGWQDARVGRQLVTALDGGREVVWARNPGSVFTRSLSTRPAALYRLLAVSGIPCCRATQFDPGEWEDAAALIHSSSGPWNLYSGLQRGGPRPGISLTNENAARKAWDRLTRDGNGVVLAEASRDLLLELLLIGDSCVATIAVTEGDVVGDGITSIENLVSAREERRMRHPYLQHFPQTTNNYAKARSRSQDWREVLAAGDRLGLTRSPYTERGGDITGFASPPVPELVPIANNLRGLLNAPPVLSVKFASRPGGERTSSRHWAVAGVTSRPHIARFAWPLFGHSPGADLYQEIMAAVTSRPRYELPVRSA